MIYNITPVAKPRMTRSDRWKKRNCVVKYWAFKDEIKKHNVSFENGQCLKFYIPMPKSWSKKEKTEHNGKPHQQTPDIDNLEKALFDAIFTCDKHIWHVGDKKKIWAYKGAIEIY